MRGFISSLTLSLSKGEALKSAPSPGLIPLEWVRGKGYPCAPRDKMMTHAKTTGKKTKTAD